MRDLTPRRKGHIPVIQDYSNCCISMHCLRYDSSDPPANIISVNGRLANQESKQYKGSRRQRIQVYNLRPDTHVQLVATFRSPVILARDNLSMSPKLILVNVDYSKKKVFARPTLINVTNTAMFWPS